MNDDNNDRRMRGGSVELYRRFEFSTPNIQGHKYYSNTMEPKHKKIKRGEGSSESGSSDDDDDDDEQW